MRFTIPGCPVGKPRQTQRDKWMQRPCVMAYRNWADTARLAAKEAGFAPKKGPICLVARFYLPVPASLSVKKAAALQGQPHTGRPDVDNLCKSVMDALLPQDWAVWSLQADKFYNDGHGSRTEVELT
jgi:Holliday junction resolvase RusA-like endonuclease